MPADNSFGYASSNAESPDQPSSSFAHRRRAAGKSPWREGRTRCSRATVIQGKIASSWRTYPLCHPGRSIGAPAQRTDPFVGEEPGEDAQQRRLSTPHRAEDGDDSPSATFRLKPSRAFVDVAPEYV